METRLDRYEGAKENKINQLRQLIEESDNVVFLGGAGVSTESGIPDFRSGEGIYNQESGLKYRPVDIISHSFFMEHPDEFYDFYKRKLLYPDAKPNKAHKALVRLEKQGKLKATITQNIDNLHQEAGSTTTIELHGSVFRNYCMECGKKFDLEYVVEHEGIPYCDKCGGMIRPDIVLYEENLEHQNVDGAIKAIKKADLLIIGGTSLTVYPAATFAQFLKHDKVVIINKSSTYLDLQALLTIHDSIGDVLDSAIPKTVPDKKPATKKTAAKKTTSKKTSTAKKADTDKKTSASKKTTSSAKKATASKKETSAKQPAAKKPAAKKPAVSKKATDAKKPADKKKTGSKKSKE
ncbi:MAG: NAD-dependent protein deacylase [Clostridiales bacterium]|nr:NAD-dependent protein deacylase [Clostridiales bacterium]